MAITQTRMMALIAAARAYQIALDMAITYTQSQLKMARRKEQTLEEATTNISYMLTKGALMENPLQHDEVIFTEAKHFERESKSNERDKLRKRESRGREFSTLGPKHTRAQIANAESFAITIPERATSAPAHLGPQSRPQMTELGQALLENPPAQSMRARQVPGPGPGPLPNPGEDFDTEVQAGELVLGEDVMTDTGQPGQDQDRDLDLPPGVDLTRDPTLAMDEKEKARFEKEIEEALAQTEVLAKKGLLGPGTSGE